MNKLKKLFLLSAVLLSALYFTAVECYAVRGGGLSVSERDLRPGGSFLLCIDVPPAENADTAAIKAVFDKDVFEVISWDAELPGCLCNSGEGFLVLAAANVSRDIDLSSGLRLEAAMRVKDSAAPGSYALKLSDASFSYVTENGYDFVELWEPKTDLVSVSVADAAGEEDSEETTVILADTEPDGSLTAAESTDKEPAKISFSAQLPGLPDVKVRFSTKRSFFAADTRIEVTNTQDARSCADKALEALGLSGHGAYPFDISAFDEASGEKAAPLYDGYIELGIPVPDELAGHSRTLCVYRTDSGAPEKIPCGIETENGTDIIVFRTSQFSPYMIADMSVGTDASSQESNDAGSSQAKGPGAGIFAAVLIPAALIVCFFLIRRKRR